MTNEPRASAAADEAPLMAGRILVVGAGAVGGHVGGHLARSGEDVTFIDPWPEHVDHINAHGLELAGTTVQECATVRVQAMHLCEVQSLWRRPPADIVFVCTKSYDTDWATRMIRPYLAEDGFVVSLQNAINEETIAAVVGWGRTVGCVASLIAVELSAPGRVERHVPLGGERHTVFRIGEPHGRETARVARVAAMLRAADSAKVTTNLWGERWSKLAGNCMRNGLAAVTGLPVRESDLLEAPRRLAIRLAAETVHVGQALGYALEDIYGLSPQRLAAAGDGEPAALAEIEDTLIERARRSSARKHRPSLAQDILKGRRTEIDYLNGFVCERGAEIGVATPANAALVALVKRLERGELAPGVEAIAGI